MCGIAGCIGRRKISEDIINNTLNSMYNRGPNNQDFNHFDKGDYFVDLLHSRLSIIDLSQVSNQPFTIGSLSLIFNGEIYNYLELRKKLESFGHIFVTNSDTEVLLRSYMHYGSNCVKYFEGMWAFAIWDNNRNELFLSRDRFGEKPLYYYNDGKSFYFASQISILKKISNLKFDVNKNHLFKYLFSGYKILNQSNETFYKNVFKFEHSTNYLIKQDLQIDKKKYYKPKYKPSNKIDDFDIINEVKKLIVRSLEIRLRADVPLSFCLSGGIDSSSLASIAAKELNTKISTYSIIDKDKRYDESKNINLITDDLKCENNKIEISNKGNLERLINLIGYHDAPITTISYFVHSFLLEQINHDNIKISISGSGADEIFTGYWLHSLLHIFSADNKYEEKNILSDWNKHLKPLIRNPMLKNIEELRNKENILNYVFYDHSDEMLRYANKEFLYDNSLSENFFSKDLLRNRMMNEMFHEVIPVLLNQDDLNSMFYSIENRSPFLDSKLYDFMNTIPSKKLIQNGYTKFYLRSAMKGILHDEVRLNRDKKGFNASINTLFDLSSGEFLDFLYQKSDISEFIDVKNLTKIINPEYTSNKDKKFIFNFINAKIFLENNI
ncbi:asparagine synthase (glutamine-hydrolyzing) [Pelagibacteraceae bacterium]|nr:asparagine synthase (glutamine-hydrolyzing) [Pelagibacteraceae bacterium]